jgi:hypothetical protein
MLHHLSASCGESAGFWISETNHARVLALVSSSDCGAHLMLVDRTSQHTEPTFRPSGPIQSGTRECARTWPCPCSHRRTEPASLRDPSKPPPICRVSHRWNLGP